MSRSWVLLIYTMPREPTAPRVAIWRKLKKLAALRLHDAAWVLPATPMLLEQMRWLVAEVREAQGTALIWHAQADEVEQDVDLAQQFTSQADAAYCDILKALDKPEADHAELARRYRQVQTIDYFHAPSGETVRTRLAGGAL
ncbi:MAG TPA: Chromate resistance protein ChrB [Ktedonobacterales bacterium]|nr:Chromate resistance protein ChrB [Ktedonobacterales bacterium]